MAAESHFMDTHPSTSGHGTMFLPIPPELKQKYPAKTHARAVATQLGISHGLIYLPGQVSQSYEDSDQPVPFRQRRYFYYLSGINFPNFLVTYNVQRDRLYAWIPPPNTGRDVIFNGQTPSVDEVRAKYDFDGVGYVAEVDAYLAYFAHKASGKIYILSEEQRPPKPIPTHLPLPNGTTSTLSLSTLRELFNSTLLKPALNHTRAIKSPHELALIRHACAITLRAHHAVRTLLPRLNSEADIEAVFLSTCISHHAHTQAYAPIVAAGTHASTLHYIANDGPLAGAQLVVLDAGCEWSCYASDVTRTFPVSGNWTKEAREVYSLVEEMQRVAIRMVKPGVDFRSVHRMAHEVALDGLMKLGLLRGGSRKEIWESGVTVAFFSHGLGHFLGLEVHDVGPTGYLLTKNSSPDWQAVFQECLLVDETSLPSSILQENMVITVEPGIYFSHYTLTLALRTPRYAQYINATLLERYYPVGGVRIEDDILVTATGWENLTAQI